MKIIYKLNIGKILLVFSIVMLLGACKSKTTVSTGGKVTEKGRTDLISNILDKEIKYSTISGKMNLELIPANSKKSVKTSTQVKLIRDSILQISIRPFLGMEVFRITLTPDSVYIVDRLNKKYVEENINILERERGAHFNFYNLQALLTNSLFIPGKQGVAGKDFNLFEVSITPDNYLLKTTDKAGTLYNFAVDASDHIVSTLLFTSDNKYTLQWSYGEFIKDGSNVYPTEMTGKADINNKRFDVKISFNKLDINRKINIDNSVSKKYEKVSASDILKALLKM